MQGHRRYLDLQPYRQQRARTFAPTLERCSPSSAWPLRCNDGRTFGERKAGGNDG